MAMPDDRGFWGDKLVEAVKNGSVPEGRVDDMAVRYGLLPKMRISRRVTDIQIGFLRHGINSDKTRAFPSLALACPRR